MAAGKSYTKRYARSYVQAARQRAEEAARPFATGEKVERHWSPTLIRRHGPHMPAAEAAQFHRQLVLNETGLSNAGRRHSGDAAVSQMKSRKLDLHTVGSRKIDGKPLTLRKFRRDAFGRFA